MQRERILFLVQNVFITFSDFPVFNGRSIVHFKKKRHLAPADVAQRPGGRPVDRFGSGHEPGLQARARAGSSQSMFLPLTTEPNKLGQASVFSCSFAKVDSANKGSSHYSIYQEPL